MRSCLQLQNLVKRKLLRVSTAPALKGEMWISRASVGLYKVCCEYLLYGHLTSRGMPGADMI